MVKIDYDGIMKRYNVKVPFELAGEKELITVASISENNKITVHRELSLRLLKQVILGWDEYEDQMKRNHEESWNYTFDELLCKYNNKKGNK